MRPGSRSGPARRGRWYGRRVPERRLFSTDAIVLSRFDYGEADRILSLLTPEHGKIKVIAKGIRRPTSRLGGSLEPLAELRVALVRGRTFDVVTQVAIVHMWLHLRDSLEATATAWYAAELADRSLEERHPAEPLYALIRRTYELLDAGLEPGRAARWYEMRLADELGQRPEVDRCVECDRLVEPDEQVRWVPSLGGIVCGRHAGPTHAEAGLSTGALRVLKAYQRMDVEAIAGLRLPPDGRAGGGGGDARVPRVRPRARAALPALPRRGPRGRRGLPGVGGPGVGGPDAGRHGGGSMIDTTTAQGARAIERARIGAHRVAHDRDAARVSRRARPIWFLWEDGEIVLCSLATTPRVRNMRANPRVAVNLNSDAGGGDIVTFEGEARIEGIELPPGTAAAYRAKYQAKIDEYGWTWESFRRDYPVVVRIRPTRVRMG